MNSELCPLFQTERFDKVVNDLGLLTVFAERFVLHNGLSSESASTHFNLLVFYGYLLLLLLLLPYLYIEVISCLFELSTITPVQHSTESCTEVIVLTLRGKDKRVYLFSLLMAFFMSMLFMCWNHSFDLSCKLGDWFLCGIGVSMENVKYISLLPSNY